MSQSPVIAKTKEFHELILLARMANRHGLITGATGTGKTVTLQKIAESFSKIGVPVFMADVKGDLSGIAAAGAHHPKLDERLEKIGVTDWTPAANPVVFWDVYGQAGHPVRATISDLGPLLLARLLNLNEVQSGVLQLVFKIADENELLLLDLKDLQAMVQFVGDHVQEFKTRYGNMSSASIGTIQRALITLEEQGGDHFFGEPMLDIHDLMHVDEQGHGVINILAADQLFQAPKLYATFLLWILSELFEHLPEVGDRDKPVLVFFFDEAHLLFADAPAVLLTKIEQVVRLIRSKGVGVYFITQNPVDIPEAVAGQLGNRIQHALRAFTPKDQKAVRAAAQTMRANPAFKTEEAIGELATGEALISFLDEKGAPAMVERAMVIAPESRMGILTPEEKTRLIEQSVVRDRYNQTIDRDSAYEMLAKAQGLSPAEVQKKITVEDIFEKHKTDGAEKNESSSTDAVMDELKSIIFGSTGPRGGKKDGLVQKTGKSVVRKLTNKLGDQIVRGILGGILGGRKK